MKLSPNTNSANQRSERTSLRKGAGKVEGESVEVLRATSWVDKEEI